MTSKQSLHYESHQRFEFPETTLNIHKTYLRGLIRPIALGEDRSCADEVTDFHIQRKAIRLLLLVPGRLPGYFRLVRNESLLHSNSPSLAVMLAAGVNVLKSASIEVLAKVLIMHPSGESQVRK